MNVGSVPYPAFPSIGYAISLSQDGKMSVPVSPSSYIYSHFKHVSGVPAPEGVSGVNINKLKIIDALVEQLSRMKNQPEAYSFETEAENEKQLNALIDRYQNQVRTLQALNTQNPYAAAAPLVGAIFDSSV
jgi:hypothetical protein